MSYCNLTASLADVHLNFEQMKHNNSRDFFGKIEKKTEDGKVEGRTNGGKVCDYTKAVGLGLIDPFVNLINLVRDVAALVIGAAKMFCSCKGNAWKDLGKRISNVCVDGGKLLLTPLLYPLGILVPHIRNGIDALRFAYPKKVEEAKKEESKESADAANSTDNVDNVDSSDLEAKESEKTEENKK